MFKKIVITGAVVALGYLGATWYVGGTAKDHIQKSVELHNANLQKYIGDTVYFSIEDYKAGLFSSSFTQRVNIKLPNFNKYIDFAYEIQNGPLPWADLSQGKFALKRYSFESKLVKNELTQALFDLAQNPFHAVASVGFDGIEKGTQFVAPFKIDKKIDEAHIVFDFGGIDSDYTYALEPFKLESISKMPKFTMKVSDPNGGIEVVSTDWLIDANYDLSDGKTNSSTKAQAANLKYIIDGIAIDLNQLSVNDSIVDDGKLMSFLTQANAKEFKIDDLNLGGLDYDTSYERIDAPAAKQIFSTVFDIVKEIMADPSGFNEAKAEALIQQQSLKLGALALAIFNHGPSLTYGPIRLTNDKGSADLSVKLDFLQPKLSGFTDPDFDVEAYIMSLINGVNVDISGNAEWFAEFLPKFTALTHKYDDTIEPVDLSTIDFKHISELFEQGLVESELFKKEGQRIKLQVLAKAPEKQSISALEKISVNGVEHGLDEAQMLLMMRAEKATELLDENGFTEAIETLFESKYEEAIPYESEETDATDASEAAKAAADEALDAAMESQECAPDDQECIKVRHELEEAIKELQHQQQEQDLVDPALSVCDPSDQACIDSFNNNKQVMSDAELAKLFCAPNDQECLKLFDQAVDASAAPQVDAAPAQ